MPAGRPTDYNQKLVDEICEQLANGYSLRAICLSDEMPAAGTICRWLGEKPEFSEQYARAREIQAEVHADAIVTIADEASVEEVQKAKLQIDARKWVASKLKPKRYGDKVQQEVTGADGAPLQVNVVRFSDTSK